MLGDRLGRPRGRLRARAGATVRDALTGGYHLAFWVAAGLMAAAIVVALTVVRRPETAGDDGDPVPADAALECAA